MFLKKSLSFVVGNLWNSETEREYYNKVSLSFLPENEEDIDSLAVLLEGITSRKNCSQLIEQMAGEPIYIPIIRALIFSNKLNKHDIERIYYYYSSDRDVCEAITWLENLKKIPENILNDILGKYPEFGSNL